MKYHVSIWAVIAFSCTPALHAIFPVNYLRPFDDVTYITTDGCRFQFGAIVEHDYKARGFDFCGNTVEPFQLWQESQDALSMIRGCLADTPVGQFAQQFEDIVDDGLIGHLIPHADIRMTSAIITTKTYLPCNFALAINLPIYTLTIDNVEWADCTPSNTADGLFVQRNLTNNDTFFRVAREFGNLYLGGLHERGVGDLYIYGQWKRNYPQDKPFLINVRPNLRLGLSAPTGKETDPRKTFSIPFGNDGAWGVGFGGGLDLTWINQVRGGLDAQFMVLYGKSLERRIKTLPAQTDFLLLNTACTRKEFGFTQRFNLYMEFHRIFGGLCLRSTYQYWRHDEDQLNLFGFQYSDKIANMSDRFEPWTMHNFIFNIYYDFDAIFSPESRIKPEISFYYKLPIAGSNSMMFDAIGGAIVLNF